MRRSATRRLTAQYRGLKPTATFSRSLRDLERWRNRSLGKVKYLVTEAAGKMRKGSRVMMKRVSIEADGARRWADDYDMQKFVIKNKWMHPSAYSRFVDSSSGFTREKIALEVRQRRSS